MSKHTAFLKPLCGVLLAMTLSGCASTNKDAKALLNPDPPGKMYASA
ncbi:MAG: hypothetical protein ACI89J_003674, partial [Hyphomicrobiaceae bacterium]